jgi:hypothetical protein
LEENKRIPAHCTVEDVFHSECRVKWEDGKYLLTLYGHRPNTLVEISFECEPYMIRHIVGQIWAAQKMQEEDAALTASTLRGEARGS